MPENDSDVTGRCEPGTYTVESGRLDEQAWSRLVERFDDAVIMQNWTYGAIRWGTDNVSHVILRKNGDVVSVAQSIIVQVPLIGLGMAYTKWGPLWRRRGSEPDVEVFRQMLRAMRQVYSVDRRLLLRVLPHAIDDANGSLRTMFAEEGFQHDEIGPTRTLLIDLSNSVGDLRQSLKGTWRRNLTIAEKHDMTIVEGSDEGLFEDLMVLYKEMQARKRRPEIADIDYFRGVQQRLPAASKLRVMICRHEGQPVAGIAVSHLGDTALNLLATTGDKGLHTRASYLLHWRMMERLHADGCRWYDLFAMNPQTHPGTTQFKRGFAGRLGREVEYLGQFHYCNHRLSKWTIGLAEHARDAYARLRQRSWVQGAEPERE